MARAGSEGPVSALRACSRLRPYLQPKKLQLIAAITIRTLRGSMLLENPLHGLEGSKAHSVIGVP